MAEVAQNKEGYTYGEWRHAMNRMPKPKEGAPPPARPVSSFGNIHTDETAKKVGMRGAVVAGSMHMDCFQPVLLKVFGPKCFETGSLSMFYTYAMLDGEELRVMVKTPPKGAKDIQVDARIEMRDGKTCTTGHRNLRKIILGNEDGKSKTQCPNKGHLHINQIGHFYFGRNRTFLLWLDSEMNFS